MTRAGYSPRKYANFFDQITMNKGKTGNWFTDAFGETNAFSQRYRTALKVLETLPANAATKKYTWDTAFQAWLKTSVDERVQTAVSANIGDQPVKLEPPLRPTLSRLRFSPDGQYIFGPGRKIYYRRKKRWNRGTFPHRRSRRGSSSVHARFLGRCLQRQQAARRALVGPRWQAHFRQKRLVVIDGCTQTQLSQDGKTLVCARLAFLGSWRARLGVRLIDVETGNTLYGKNNFWDYAIKLELLAHR